MLLYYYLEFISMHICCADSITSTKSFYCYEDIKMAVIRNSDADFCGQQPFWVMQCYTSAEKIEESLQARQLRPCSFSRVIREHFFTLRSFCELGWNLMLVVSQAPCPLTHLVPQHSQILEIPREK